MCRRDATWRRGAAAVLAMLYLTLFASLAVAMFAMSSMNVQTASNLEDGERARAIAESGLRWMQHRFLHMNRPKTTIGQITPAVANSLWPDIRAAVTAELGAMLNPAERPVTFEGNVLSTSPIAADAGAGRFVVSITQNPADARFLAVSSTGTYRSASRTVAMFFRIDKKVKFAIVGKVPIQIGRNTLIEGPIAMTTPNKYPPLLMLSDFRHLTADLTARIDAFHAFLEDHHLGYDNRIAASNSVEYQAATSAGFHDYNGDSFIDEYDLFLDEFDSDGDKAITADEFTNPLNGNLYDPDLFAAIDSLGAPLDPGDPIRAGYQDGVIDNRDGYTKIRGQVSVATTVNDWEAHLASGQSIQDLMSGPISPENPFSLPVRFGATPADVFDLSPANFDTSGFRAQTGPENGNSLQSPAVLENLEITPAMANGGTVDEQTPLGSTSYQATYRRPVFRNMTIRNCRIPKGVNALFDNCVFEGVTFVDLETNITDSSGNTTTDKNVAMAWSKRMKSGSFNKSTPLTRNNSWGFALGNNLRFNNCTIRGPIASSVPSAYSHFTNSMEFTGATRFDNQWIDPASQQTTATLVVPQTNIEMGSFLAPGTAPSTLQGVVVAGNLDIRGSSVVDGAVIITGDGAGNTTQGWFGPSDSSTDPDSPMPEGGWGKLNIRYNPHRALPDGINVAIDILPEIGTYTEGN